MAEQIKTVKLEEKPNANLTLFGFLIRFSFDPTTIHE